MRRCLALSALFVLYFSARSMAVVYGVDNRIEALEARSMAEDSRAVGMLMVSTFEHVEDYPAPARNRAWLTFQTQAVVEKNDFRGFIDQPRVGDCTSFLIRSDLMVTAGHCIRNDNDCEHTTVVFDYFKPKVNSSTFNIPAKSIYRCKKLISRDFEPSDTLPSDYAIFQIDRPAIGRKPLKLSREPLERLSFRPLSILGFPRGVFMKYANQGVVWKIESKVSFRTNLDSFQCNSGSPVFDEATHEVVGILISGSWDETVKLINGEFRKIDIGHRQFPAPGTLQFNYQPLYGEQVFYSGTILRKLKQAGYWFY